METVSGFPSREIRVKAVLEGSPLVHNSEASHKLYADTGTLTERATVPKRLPKTGLFERQPVVCVQLIINDSQGRNIRSLHVGGQYPRIDPESMEEVIELPHQLIEMFKTAGQLTKRKGLSTIARIFDPLCLYGPLITWAKIFIQRLWLLELGWSDELPFKEEKEWRRFIDYLEAVNNISIDRCIVIHRTECIELHAFSDASEKAYGSSIYLKSIYALGEVKKSRVSSLKQISISRLELCGAVLAAKLMLRFPRYIENQEN
ncbi:integrase catalytic domain-containing protein [Trichonephila clavipes]|nr:integrase catalytic domain-containing protein [Trichonephila clavipes]